METFFSNILTSIINYFSIIGLLIFKNKKASILFFSPRFRKTRKVQINRYVILSYTILFYFVIKAITYYFTDNLDKSYISELLTNKYFNNEGEFRLLIALVPFVVIIHGICFAFISNKIKRESWLDFFIMNFSAQVFLVISIVSLALIFIPHVDSFFSNFMRLIITIIIFIFLANTFGALYYAEKNKFISMDSYIYAFFLSFVLPFIFVYFFSFSKQNNKVECQFFFQNEKNEKIALAVLDSISPDLYKLSIKCFIILDSKAPLIFGSSSKKLSYMACWPLLGKFKTKEYVNECTRLFIESKEELIFIKQNDPHFITLASYLTKRQLESILLVYSTQIANNFKISANGNNDVKNELINYYNDSIEIKKNY